MLLKSVTSEVSHSNSSRFSIGGYAVAVAVHHIFALSVDVKRPFTFAVTGSENLFVVPALDSRNKYLSLSICKKSQLIITVLRSYPVTFKNSVILKLDRSSALSFPTGVPSMLIAELYSPSIFTASPRMDPYPGL